MVEFLLGVAIGLIVGWNFLKQPVWVAEFVAKVKKKIFGGE